MSKSKIENEVNNEESRGFISRFFEKAKLPLTAITLSAYLAGCVCVDAFHQVIIGDAAVRKGQEVHGLFEEEGKEVYKKGQELGIIPTDPKMPEFNQYAAIFKNLEAESKKIKAEDLTRENLDYKLEDVQLRQRLLVKKGMDFNSQYLEDVKEKDRANVQKSMTGVNLRDLDREYVENLMYRHIREGGLETKTDAERYLHWSAAAYCALANGDDKSLRRIHGMLKPYRTKEMIKTADLGQIPKWYLGTGIYERAVAEWRRDKKRATTYFVIGAILLAVSASAPAASTSSGGGSAGGGAGAGAGGGL
ncbi:hypothetical protein KY331_04060 [Candidatus Woesearchaeota archaeon]|nr:hypothetical protein [Candidatus Woesearchaeota archaeon]